MHALYLSVRSCNAMYRVLESKSKLLSPFTGCLSTLFPGSLILVSKMRDPGNEVGCLSHFFAIFFWP